MKVSNKREVELRSASQQILKHLGIALHGKEERNLYRSLKNFYSRGRVDMKRDLKVMKKNKKFSQLPPPLVPIHTLILQLRNRVTISTIKYSDFSCPDYENPKERMLEDFIEDALINEGRRDE